MSTTKAIIVCGLGGIGLLVLSTGCMHYKEESGRKTEYNSDKGRFETSDYASAGFTSAKPEPKPVNRGDLDKALRK
jgi:hypothetical protein